MKFPYANDYFPPAPVMQVRFALPDKALRLGPIPALVDSGADVTIVPASIPEMLGAESDNDKVIRAYSGGGRIVKMYYLDIAIGEQRYPAVMVAADPQADQVMIGRNLLNKLIITLNGPRQELEIKI
ncbi:MAG: hypothetical protein HY741_23425 [Chloroflexi bacterium]|nr:hypothetical protein [Chloroflexota bacterium]